jgi:hypothetical protein
MLKVTSIMFFRNRFTVIIVVTGVRRRSYSHWLMNQCLFPSADDDDDSGRF